MSEAEHRASDYQMDMKAVASSSEAKPRNAEDLEQESLPSPPPDGGYGWVVLLCVFMSNAGQPCCKPAGVPGLTTNFQRRGE